MTSARPQERRTAYFSGQVQGVGFRYTTRAVAGRFAVTGYVRNLPDGRVELVAEGEKPELNAFFSGIRDQLGDHIRSERSDSQAASGEFAGFEIRH
jgi:acylphosphatase